MVTVGAGVSSEHRLRDKLLTRFATILEKHTAVREVGVWDPGGQDGGVASEDDGADAGSSLLRQAVRSAVGGSLCTPWVRELRQYLARTFPDFLSEREKWCAPIESMCEEVATMIQRFAETQLEDVGMRCGRNASAKQATSSRRRASSWSSGEEARRGLKWGPRSGARRRMRLVGCLTSSSICSSMN